MRYLLIFTLCWINPLFAQKSVQLDRKEAKKAFHYLNEFRTNPNREARKLGLRSIKNVSEFPLVWNEDLAKAAEEKALDMAKRNYFDHVDPKGFGPNYYIHKAGYSLHKDWIKNKSTNNFESIAANHETAIAGIQAFIIGKGSPGFMHRKHVLGLDEWNGSLKDIGIGFVRVPRGATYKTYLCVLIAKHDW
ncbi:CAP domain-containing protein [Sphingobacterium sp. HJSM2_6]|uniref:CAP domain-containing protein n=1 Tax=Sphingobacterium sp. HJSM2_6 TaxID=3366264 RepID=UPI003BE5BB0C